MANPSADVALNLVLTAHDKPVGMVSATAPSMDGEVELISLWVAPAAEAAESGTKPPASTGVGIQTASRPPGEVVGEDRQ